MNALTFATLVVAVCGCAAAPDVSATATTSAEVPHAHVGVRAALGDIAQAQCARARACGAVSRCEDIGTATRAELLGRDCDVIDGAYLAACIDAIRNQACAPDPMTEHAPAVCQSAWLCR